MKPIVVVTGADGALGQAVCAVFVAELWSVHACVRSRKSETFLTSLGVDSIIVTELSDASSLAENLTHLHVVDAVVHCAGGITAGTPIESTSVTTFHDMMNMNVLTTFSLMQCTIPKLKVRGGTFVAIGAQSVLVPSPMKSAYSAAKAAVISLTQSLAEEGRPHGIRAHVIVPSILKTPANMEWASNGEENGWVEPSAVAQTIHTLCSADSRHMSGLVVPLLSPMG